MRSNSRLRRRTQLSDAVREEVSNVNSSVICILELYAFSIVESNFLPWLNHGLSPMLSTSMGSMGEAHQRFFIVFNAVCQVYRYIYFFFLHILLVLYTCILRILGRKIYVTENTTILEKTIFPFLNDTQSYHRMTCNQQLFNFPIGP